MEPASPSDVHRLDPANPVPDDFDPICEHCGYSLVGIMSDRCPERMI